MQPLILFIFYKVNRLKCMCCHGVEHRCQSYESTKVELCYEADIKAVADTSSHFLHAFELE